MLSSKRLLLAAPILSLIALSACSTAQRKPDHAVVATPLPVDTASTVETEDLPALPESAPELDSGALTREIQKEIEKEVHSTDSALEPQPHAAVPMEINEHVERWVHYFSVKDRARFTTFITRGAKYRELVQGILAEHGIPAEIYYLAMIESGYVTHARSRASAVGAWQFMRPTARLYGLKVDRELDERRDIVRSTRAAARYLKRLHDEFQSWYLAMAAYNAGEGRIRGSIRKGGTKDFWQLVERRAMPRETMDYVPKFLAATLIGKNPAKFGIAAGDVAPFPKVESVTVPRATDLRKLAQLADLPVNSVTDLNPHLAGGVTPRSGNYAVWVPAEHAPKIAQYKLVAAAGREGRARARLASFEYPAKKRAPRARTTQGRVVHRVRPGDTLSSIARKYNVSTRQLRQLNKMRGNRVRLGQELKIRRNET